MSTSLRSVAVASGAVSRRQAVTAYRLVAQGPVGAIVVRTRVNILDETQVLLPQEGIRKNNRHLQVSASMASTKPQLIDREVVSSWCAASFAHNRQAPTLNSHGLPMAS